METTAAMADELDELILETLLSDEGRADPYPRYQRLRQSAPVHRSGIGAVWFLTRYDDINAVLRDPRLGKDDLSKGRRGLFGPSLPPGQRSTLGRSMLFVNPPDHTRLRGLVSRGFTPRRVHAMQDSIGAMCDEILDEIADQTEVDLMEALAFRLPVQVIGQLVGVPAEDWHQFRFVVREMAAALEPGASADDLEGAESAMTMMRAYFADLIAQRRTQPRDDLASILIEVRDGSDRLSEDEMIATLILLFAAGFETTTNLIGNGVLNLLRHPAELDALHADPALSAGAVEETLRFDSPVQVDARTAFEAVDIDGNRVEEGETVVMFLGAANRDPLIFDHPERFDIRRDPNHPLSFAAGIHYCLGANLARAEGTVVFDRLVRRFRSIEWMDEAPAWRGTFILRGLDHLHVRATAA
jgi:cytochrome P450